MDITVLNSSFQKIYILDSVDSIIWTDRYDKCGDFELYTPITADLISVLQENNWLTMEVSDRLMTIESIEVKSKPEEGAKLLVKGRSLESVLDRRVVYNQTLLDEANIDNAIEKLMNDAFIIVGGLTQRYIAGMTYINSADSRITTLPFKAQFLGENLYDVITAICKTYGLGFKITKTPAQYQFRLYLGQDRSYGQSTNPFVVFSPAFDNLRSGDYFHTNQFLKNYARIRSENTFGQVQLTAQWISPPGGGYPSGFDLREVLADARHISPFYAGTSDPIPGVDWLNQLWSFGRDTLYNSGELEDFSGEADVTNTYKYGTDFSLGDIIQFEDGYGHVGKAKVTEITFSENINGYNVYPTFEKV